MAKCKNCGKGGFFLKLENGICSNCIAEEKHKASVAQLEAQQQTLSAQVSDLTAKLADQQALFNSICSNAHAQGIAQARAAMQAEQDAATRHVAELMAKTNADIQSKQAAADRQLSDTTAQLEAAEAKLALAKTEEESAQKNAASAIRKVEKHRPFLKSILHALDSFDGEDSVSATELAALALEAEEFVSPTVILDLQCLGMKDLRKRYRQNEKNIEEILKKYEGRYTTKANATIYKLMVIALRAELQNVLYNISYGKLEDALADIAGITTKYYDIATSGNQSIAPTMKKFIGEIDYFFQEAVKIEYEYYVQKERAKEEQRAIREQMRQEAEERRALEAERKKIEKEESKYQDQITQLEEQLSSADSEKTAQLEARLAELQAQLEAVKEKKDVIVNLQNGKAGNVYVISNLGSFGENVFKIGMTRRAEPQERIDELGDASVPFPFDVHSFIFSDDAAALETEIHHILNDRRVNKVNLRKEFFHISLDELEELVGRLAPTAEFKRTMLAEQYRQSLSIDKIVETVQSEDDSDDEE